MAGRIGRQLVWLGMALMLVALQAGPSRAEEMAVTGVILESGFSGVVLRAQGKGEGVKYNTGRETRYSPADYNPVAGDTVKLTYYKKMLKNGEDVLAVSTLTLVKMDPNRKELTSPAVGTVVEIGRKSIRFDFPASGERLSMERKRGMEMVPAGYDPTVGDKVKVSYEKVRSKFGGGIVYVMERIEKVK
ncbi:hypothetical protein JCM30471_15810 [Desulfuromonas carbonis]|uniref:hypothetical protein n=1 Tax=Desulfuromonas sp. DDH964 TaxID=1823759 RepID=UPI00078E2919|nr:hypothetical protein [Desulfuromonas sp. DDH964]AMV73172.1 hypothetical protein DBW_2863 [Desulfuromonas sp. DDH964]